MNKILVPLDGSDFGRQILAHLRRLLNPAESNLILFRVAELREGVDEAGIAEPPMGDLPFPVYEPQRDTEPVRGPESTGETWERFRTRLIDELQADVVRLQDAGYTVSVAVGFGDPAQEIVDFVEGEGVDLVAMATHGRTGLSRLLCGSIAERVVRSISVPVMLLRPFEEPAGTEVPGATLARRLEEGEPLRLAVATDGSPFAWTATAFAGDLAGALGAKVTVLGAFREEDGAVRGRDILDEARDLLGELEPAPESVALTGFADEAIIQHLARNPYDLLVIGAFGDRGATRFLIGSTAQRLVHHAPLSVLVVKGRQPAFDKILACTAVGDGVVVDVAGQLARTLGADLKLLHVVPPSAAMYLTLPDVIDIPLAEVLAQGTPLARHLQVCANKFEALGFDDSDIHVRRGAVPDAIFQEARDGQFDLIVVGSQAGPVQDRYWIGSIADRVAKYAHRSVLVVRTTRQ